jgi:putative transposase
MPMLVQKSFKYRFFPTDSQKKQLAQTFGCARLVWNWALEMHSEGPEQEKISLNYNATANALTQLKKTPEKAFLKEVSSVVLQQSLRNLETNKFTTKTIRENQAVYVEGLNVAGMLKNHNLAKHLSDASFAEIFRQLEYKADWYERDFVQLDQFFPSTKTCGNCGHLLVNLPLSVREWTCPSCNAKHERDENAAQVILLAGRSLRATGSDARKVNAYEIRGVDGHSA